MSEITEAQRDESLTWLHDNAEEIGRAYGGMKGYENQMRVEEAVGMDEAEGAVELRRAHARSRSQYRIVVSRHQQACIDYKTAEVLREFHQSRLDAFRTQQSDRRGLDHRAA